VTSPTADSIVALVPAKAHSRRVPDKNVALLAGIPMFGHAVRLARAVPRIGRVLVSSDSPVVLALAERYGAVTLARPPELCTDEATNFDVLRHCLAWLRAQGNAPELLVLLQPTTPFRTPGPLDEMIGRMASTPDADSLVTVAAVTRAVGAVEDSYWTPADTAAPGPRVQSRTPQYGISGHVFILRPERTLDRGTILGQRVLAEPLPDAWLDLDIDTPNDMLLAQQAAEPFFRTRFP
jgi:CMP-N,N'-diacetyllegionaminic acid synthase